MSSKRKGRPVGSEAANTRKGKRRPPYNPDREPGKAVVLCLVPPTYYQRGNQLLEAIIEFSRYATITALELPPREHWQFFDALAVCLPKTSSALDWPGLEALHSTIFVMKSAEDRPCDDLAEPLDRSR